MTGLPTNGSTVYVTLYSLVSGQWLSNAYAYTAFNAAAAAGVLTTPTPGSTLTGSSVPFTWTAGAGASAYWLDVGSTAGGNQYYQSGNLGNVLTTTVNGLPTDGSTVYVTLYSLMSGGWQGNAYTYNAFNASGGLAVMQTPIPGSTLNGNTETFTWNSDANAASGRQPVLSIREPGQRAYYDGVQFAGGWLPNLRDPLFVYRRAVVEQLLHLYFGPVNGVVDRSCFGLCLSLREAAETASLRARSH